MQTVEISSARKSAKRVQIIITILAAAWAVIRVGPAIISHDYLDLYMQWPGAELPEAFHFIRSSPIGPLFFGSGPAFTYVVAHIVAIVLAVTLMAAWAAKNTIAGDRWASARFVLLSPITAVLLITIGLYDPFTVIGIAAAFWAWSHSNRWLLLFVGIYLGFQHFEQGLLVLIIWMLSLASLRNQLPQRLSDVSQPVWLLPGLVVGKIILMIALTAQGLPALQGRTSVFSDYLLTALGAGAGNFPAYVWFSFTGLWLLVIILSCG